MSDKAGQDIPRFKQQSIFAMIVKGVIGLAVIYLVIRFVKPDLIPPGLRFF